MLYLYDDALARRAEPFALTRPWGEVRAGGLLVRERWEYVFGTKATGFIGAPHLARFSEFEAPPAVSPGSTLSAGSVIVNARFAPALTLAGNGDNSRYLHANQVVALRLAADLPAAALADGTLDLGSLGEHEAASEIGGWWMERPWDLIRYLTEMLAADIPALGATLTTTATTGAHVLGPYPVIVEADATVEPLVVFDAQSGPILVRRGAAISAFTRVTGPCLIGPGSHILGGRVGSSSIGEHCRVHGEMSTTIMIGYANKGHDGFIGHSVLARWSNLGAGTITSNLKNTYGQVNAWTPDGLLPTRMQFLGSLVGDHGRTAIGTRLTTGAVVGTGANVLATGLTPRVIAPFAFGETTYELAKFLEVAERVMARRGVALGDAGRAALAAAYHARWSTSS